MPWERLCVKWQELFSQIIRWEDKTTDMEENAAGYGETDNSGGVRDGTRNAKQCCIEENEKVGFFKKRFGSERIKTVHTIGREKE